MDHQERFDRGEYTALIAELKDSTNADGLRILALSYQKCARYEEAMEVWNRLIGRLPEVASFYLERGVCKFNLRFTHALSDFDTAIQLEPDNPYFHACRAYVKDKFGDSEGAVSDYRRAHELDPEDAVTLNNLGLAEQKLGYTSKARAFFKKSNDLLGIETADAREPEPAPRSPGFSAKWKEVRRMLSSFSEFRSFLRDLFRK